jgi:hypothetical protein
MKLQTTSIGLTGLLIGLVPAFVMLGIAFFMYSQQMAFINSSVQAPGTVIKNQSHMSVDSNDHVYAPVVSFMTPDGQTHQFEEGVQSSPPAHQVGEGVQVLYNAKNPEDAHINNPFDLFLGVWIVGGIGAAFLVITLFIFVTGQFGQKRVLSNDEMMNYWKS